jgi:hypothetical protein
MNGRADLQRSGRDYAAFALRMSRGYHEALPCRPKVGHQLFAAGVSRVKGIHKVSCQQILTRRGRGSVALMASY